MPISGTEGYVRKDGVLKPASKWSADLASVVVDRSNFLTEGDPLNAAGQRTGEVTMSGPIERDPPGGAGPLAFTVGSLAVLTLGLTEALFINVTVRVSRYQIMNDKDSGPEWSLTGSQFGPASAVHV